MKVVVIFAVLFAYAQATSEPITVQQLASNALNHCVQEKGLDKNKIKGFFSSDFLPEDDPEFTDFFVCYWKQALVIKDDGTFDDLHIKVSAPHLLRDKYQSISENDAVKLVEDAVEHCKDAPHAETFGLTAIKYRNCLIKYVKNSQE